MKCHNCKESVPSGDQFAGGGKIYCCDCFNDLFTRCAHNGELCVNDEVYYGDDKPLCIKCIKLLGFGLCLGCSEYTRHGRTTEGRFFCNNCMAGCMDCSKWGIRVHMETLPCGWVCKSCYKKSYTKCVDCGDKIHKNRTFEEDRGPCCETCALKLDYSSYETYYGDTYDTIKSERCFGLEVETHRCKNYADLEYHDAWRAKYEDTVDGKEFASAILCGDKGLEAIDDLCKVAKVNSWEVNDTCGLHIHVDLTKESVKSLRRIAFAYEYTRYVWKELVSKERQDNTWCSSGEFDFDARKLKTKKDWRELAYDTNRYSWVNWCAYNRFGSLEIRSHEGTVDDVAIKNWTKAHLSFVDWAVKHSISKIEETFSGNLVNNFDALCDIWEQAGHSNLVAYYIEKTDMNLQESTWELCEV